MGKALLAIGLSVLAGTALLAFRYRGQFLGDFSLGVATSTLSALALLAFGAIRLAQRHPSHARVRVLAFFYPTRRLRLSAAYIYRFEVEHDFLLVRNLAHGNVAPVGGVYKFYESAHAQLNEMHFVQALGVTLPLPDKFDRDLRIAVDLRYAPRLLEWFESGVGREYCPDREFREELIDTGLVADCFPFTQVECSKYTTCTDLSPFDAATNCYNFHHFDVFCLKLTPVQRQTIATAVARDHQGSAGDPNRQRLFIATAEEIQRGRLHNGQQLGPHTRHIL